MNTGTRGRYMDEGGGVNAKPDQTSRKPARPKGDSGDWDTRHQKLSKGN